MADSPEFVLRPIASSDRDWIRQLTMKHWSGTIVVSRGRIHHPDELPGFIAERQGLRCGLLTFHIEGSGCEIVTLDSLVEGMGIGSALVEAARQSAGLAGCRRLWLITTNDNLNALRFYQKRGFHLVAIYPDALKATRSIKPALPQAGLDGIPLRDEIELELLLIHDAGAPNRAPQ